MEGLKANAPKAPENVKGAKAKLRNKFEQGHLDLISFLEANLPKVDTELSVSTRFLSSRVPPALERINASFPHQSRLVMKKSMAV